MIAVIFEVWPADGQKQSYLDTAAALRPELEKIDGFISVERFQSITEPGKMLSLSFFPRRGGGYGMAQHTRSSTGAEQRPWRRIRRLPAADRKRDPRLRHQ
jgi:hypothetical protein